MWIKNLNSCKKEITMQLWDAVLDRELEEIERTVFLGAEINARDDNGQTILFKAPSERKINELISLGGSLLVKDLQGRTPASYMREQGKQSLADYVERRLLAKEEIWWDNIYQLIEKDDVDAVKVELSNPDILPFIQENSSDKIDADSLTDALFNVKSSDMVRLLIEKGADPDAKGYNFAPLHHVWNKDNGVEIGKALLKNGANVNRINIKFGTTPLFYVKTKALAQLFLDYGADTKIKDCNGLTPAQFIGRKHSDLANFINLYEYHKQDTPLSGLNEIEFM